MLPIRPKKDAYRSFNKDAPSPFNKKSRFSQSVQIKILPIRLIRNKDAPKPFNKK